MEKRVPFDVHAAAEASAKLWSARAVKEMEAYVSTFPPVSPERLAALAAERLDSKMRAQRLEDSAKRKLAILLADLAPVFVKHGATLRLIAEDHGDTGFGHIEIDSHEFYDVLIDYTGEATFGPCDDETTVVEPPEDEE